MSFLKFLFTIFSVQGTNNARNEISWIVLKKHLLISSFQINKDSHFIKGIWCFFFTHSSKKNPQLHTGLNSKVKSLIQNV